MHSSNSQQVSKENTKSNQEMVERRSAIEPVIGHMKNGNRMNCNKLKGKLGDKINAVLSACGFNFRKLLRAIALFFVFVLKMGFFNVDYLVKEPRPSGWNLLVPEGKKAVNQKAYRSKLNQLPVLLKLYTNKGSWESIKLRGN